MTGKFRLHWLTLLAVPVLLVSIWLYTFQLIRTSMDTIKGRHIVLLIAHPDDEAMFFAPTIVALAKPELGNTLRVICFSSGDADGLGSIRKKELQVSCAMLGIPTHPHSVTVIEHDLLPDSMITTWPADTLSSLLVKTLSTHPEVDTLLTFDRDGISSHPNHISLLQGAKQYIRSLPHPHPLLLYTLSTVAIHRKYASIFDGFTTLLLKYITGGKGWGGEGAPRDVLCVSGWDEYRTAQRAMVDGHKSQMRWFRWGWIIFSRYMVMNDLKLQDIVM